MKSLTDPTWLRRWLKRKLAWQIAERLFVGFLSLLVGIVVLATTCFFIYLVVIIGVFGASAFARLVFDRPVLLSQNVELVISLLFLVLLFVGNYRTRRDDLGAYKLQNKVFPAASLSGALFALFANPEGTGKIVSDLFFAGPRLTTYAISSFCGAFRLMKTDLDTAAEALAILSRRLHRTSLNELTKLLARRDPLSALRQLQELDFVLFLAKEPVSVIVTEAVREELNLLLGSPTDTESAPAAEPVVTCLPENWEQYELLGLTPGASLAEVKAAYRERIKQCHPDKFVGRGAEFRQLAEERAKAVNAAYKTLLGKFEAAGDRT